MSDVSTAVEETPKMGAPKPAAAKVRRAKNLPTATDSRLSVSPDGHRYADIQYTVKQGETLGDVTRPEYWAQVAHRFTFPVSDNRSFSGAVIGVWTEDHSWHAKLYVRAVQKAGVIIEVLEHYKLGNAPKLIKEAQPYEVKWNVGKQGFDVIRNSDREYVVDGKDCPTREMAEHWIKEQTGGF